MLKLRQAERISPRLPLLWFLQMKTATDPRHLRRREAVQTLFAETYTTQPNPPELVQKILAQKDRINHLIEAAAPQWPIDKLNKIDLAILYLAIYELESGEAPPKVIIDEAVELAKEFGSESSSSFINGVLGTIYKDVPDKHE
jgi:N utilization substance protein B